MLAVIICPVAFFFCYFTFYQWAGSLLVPNVANLIQWDAKWYDKIVEYGYYYKTDQMSTMAFFPLFPLLWKLSGLNAVGISIVNMLLFLLSFRVLAGYIKLDFRLCLIFIISPCFVFCIIPYSEALFFLGSTVFLIGLNKQDHKLTVTGIVIAAFTRSISMVFIVSLLFTYLTATYSKATFKSLVRQYLLYFLLLVAILFTVFLIQYFVTGQWLVFFKVQRLWNRELRMPVFPFTTVNGPKIAWLDGLALMVSLLSLATCIYLLFKKYIRQQKYEVSPAVLFSMTYLALAGFLATFYSGVWRGNEGTSLMCLDRYVFATPFFIFFIHWFSGTSLLKHFKPYLVILCFIAVCFMLGGYKITKWHSSYLATLTYFVRMGLLPLVYALALINRKSIFYYLSVCIQFFIIIHLYHEFLSGDWIG